MSMVGFEKFYGRKSILNLLKKRVLDLKEGYRQNIAFLGVRYAGKSFILQKFFYELDEKDIVTVYLDLDHKDFSYIFSNFAGGLLYNYCKSENLPLYEDLKLLTEVAQNHLPQTVKAVKKIKTLIKQGKFAEAYSEILSLPQIFSLESGKYCVLVLDEFQNLEELGFPGVFQELGRRIMTQKKCLYIVTSSQPCNAVKILSEKLSLLFGNFEVVDIGPFDLKTSQEFIDFYLKDLVIAERLRSFLIDFTGGYPLYLQLICQELKALTAVHKQAEIFKPLLAQAIENILFNPWGVLSRHFDITVNRVCSGKGNQMMAGLLLELSAGKRRIKDFTTAVELNQNQITQRMNRLIETGVVEKNGIYYYLKDKLFRYWVKYVFQRWRKTIDLNPDKLRGQFLEELQQGMEVFEANARRDLSSRIVELLYCFDNEAFQINGRRYKLPPFREIVTKRVSLVTGDFFEMIQASCPEGDWCIVFKPEAIVESDISAILTESKKLQARPQKCILISLSNIDENARVKALQERMWIWNEGELNTLLNLYDKPYIVC